MRELRALALVVVLSLTLGACGDNGPTTAPASDAATPAPSQAANESTAPSTAPTPEPTPEPVDVVANATSALADPALTANVAIDATTKIGKVTTTGTGTADVDGRATHLVRADKTGKLVVKTEWLVGNGDRYVKTKGVWVKAGTASGDGLVALLGTVSGMTDLGIEDKDGAQLHHLQTTWTQPIPAELGFSTKGVSNLVSTLDAWVQEDGTPVVYQLTSTWDQAVGKKTVKASKTATFTFTNVGGDVTVTVPTDIWTFYTSKKYGYRMGYPADWSLQKGKGKFADSYYGDNEYVYASRARRNGNSLTAINKQILSALKDMTKYKSLKVTSNKPAKLDGQAARRIEFTGKSDGSKIYGQGIFAVKGPYWYFIGMDSYDKTSKESRALFSTFIGTFDFK